MAKKWNKDHVRLDWNLDNLFESNETLSQHAHEFFYLKFVFFFFFLVRSFHSGFWQRRGHEEEVEIDGLAKGYVANCCVIGWTKRRTLLWPVEQRTWRRDFGSNSEWEKHNYFKCSYQFHCSGSLPQFSVKTLWDIDNQEKRDKLCTLSLVCYCRCVMNAILSL